MKSIYGYNYILPFQGANGIGRLLPKALPLGWDITGLQPVSKWLKTIYNPAQRQRLGDNNGKNNKN